MTEMRLRLRGLRGRGTTWDPMVGRPPDSILGPGVVLTTDKLLTGHARNVIFGCI